MQEPAPPAIRTGRAAPASGEVAEARARYVRLLRSQVREGTYFTRERIDRALDRFLAKIREDLPQDPVE